MSTSTTTRAPLLTIPEVARRLGLHRDTVYRKIQRGEIPAVRIGRDETGPASRRRARARAVGLRRRCVSPRVKPKQPHVLNENWEHVRNPTQAEFRSEAAKGEFPRAFSDDSAFWKYLLTPATVSPLGGMVPLLDREEQSRPIEGVERRRRLTSSRQASTTRSPRPAEPGLSSALSAAS